MKYIKEYNEYIDPFNEEDWDEVEPPHSEFLKWLKIKYPDENKWKNIKEINCRNSNLTDLIGIEKLINLKSLSCEHNQLSELDITKNIKLKYLHCGHNQVTKLKLNKNLEELYCNYNQLTELDVSNNINLECLYCNYNQLTELDFRDTKLKCYSYENNPLIVIRKSKFHFRRFFKKIKKLFNYITHNVGFVTGSSL